MQWAVLRGVKSACICTLRVCVWYGGSCLWLTYFVCTARATAAQCDVICSHYKFVYRRASATDKHFLCVFTPAERAGEKPNTRSSASCPCTPQKLHQSCNDTNSTRRSCCSGFFWSMLCGRLLLLHLMATTRCNNTLKHAAQTWLIVGEWA